MALTVVWWQRKRERGERRGYGIYNEIEGITFNWLHIRFQGKTAEVKPGWLDVRILLFEIVISHLYTAVTYELG